MLPILCLSHSVAAVDPVGMWWAAVPKEKWHHPEGQRPDDMPEWDARFGDRMQQLVFIGQDMDREYILNRLEGCLLEEELLESTELWATLPNPFPALQWN